MNGKIMHERVLHKVLDICVICVCMSVIDTVVLHKQIIVYFIHTHSAHPYS